MISYSDSAGRIHGVFSSIFCAVNKDVLEEKFAEQSLKMDQEWYGLVEEISIDMRHMLNDYAYFFNLESRLYRCFLDIHELWMSKDIHQYLDTIKGMNATYIKCKLIKSFFTDGKKYEDETIECIANDKNKLLNYISELEISKGAKWDIFCFIQSIDDCKNTYIQLLKDYIPIYEAVCKEVEHKSTVHEAYIRGRIEREGKVFVDAYTRMIADLDAFDQIYLTNSYFDTCSIYFDQYNNFNNCYVIMGHSYAETHSGTYIEEQLKVIKNLSDKTRLNILTYILSSKRYGQEIAEKFEISNASVSYHMNNLLHVNLVTVSREDNKVYYKINKDIIKQTIAFLEKEFNL